MIVAGTAVGELTIGVVDDDSNESAKPTGATNAPTKAPNSGTRKGFSMASRNSRPERLRALHPFARLTSMMHMAELQGMCQDFFPPLMRVSSDDISSPEFLFPSWVEWVG